MTSPFMLYFVRDPGLRLARLPCHRRHGSPSIPIKNNPEANGAVLAKVRADKLREVTDGHDGTWVAHPGLVPIALDIFK